MLHRIIIWKLLLLLWMIILNTNEFMRVYLIESEFWKGFRKFTSRCHFIEFYFVKNQT